MSKELELLRKRLVTETQKELEFKSVLEIISKLCNSTSAVRYALEIQPFENTDYFREERKSTRLTPVT